MSEKCKNCGSTDLPTIPEERLLFSLFGRDFIIRRYDGLMDECNECLIDSAPLTISDDDARSIFNDGAQHGYEEARKEIQPYEY